MLPDFDYDPDKSLINKAKHGIDFEEAKALWLDKRLLEAPARTMDEARWLAVGLPAGKHWTVVFTRRGGVIRLISARRARDGEITAYESTDL
ncbi:MAG TPA: BrnT family toxin [Methylocystis sp.]|nr:BrnT family toxin [Methylocystis sp.]